MCIVYIVTLSTRQWALNPFGSLGGGRSSSSLRSSSTPWNRKYPLIGCETPPPRVVHRLYRVLSKGPVLCPEKTWTEVSCACLRYAQLLILKFISCFQTPCCYGTEFGRSCSVLGTELGRGIYTAGATGRNSSIAINFAGFCSWFDRTT